MTMLPNQNKRFQPIRFRTCALAAYTGLKPQGTGKTYTLSSLMVRIFLDQYYPHQVIATTFTRKATAELKTGYVSESRKRWPSFSVIRS